MASAPLLQDNIRQTNMDKLKKTEEGSTTETGRPDALPAARGLERAVCLSPCRAQQADLAGGKSCTSAPSNGLVHGLAHRLAVWAVVAARVCTVGSLALDTHLLELLVTTRRGSLPRSSDHSFPRCSSEKVHTPHDTQMSPAATEACVITSAGRAGLAPRRCVSGALP